MRGKGKEGIYACSRQRRQQATRVAEPEPEPEPERKGLCKTKRLENFGTAGLIKTVGFGNGNGNGREGGALDLTPTVGGTRPHVGALLGSCLLGQGQWLDQHFNYWDGMGWDGMGWDGMGWDGTI
ncbi:hypothetical protein V6N13_143387 [Hibiscus sabdariffa]|uniref:Uncharacterized protein n=1 Tax=Hibiscus sabdariffa TaxID=183260 RepID=A0ABR2FH66_9ROSI